MAKFPIKVKRFICKGELDGREADTDDILDSCADALDACESHEILGTVLFEGEDGKFYSVTVEANIGEADPEFVKQTIEEQGGQA